MTTSFEVHSELDGELLTAPEAIPIPVGWSWSLADPFTVALRFAAPRAQDPESTWVIARDLLVRGLGQPVGIGDVRVRPDTDDDTPPGLLMTLDNGQTRAEFWFDKTRVLLFLSETLQRCPLGDELSWVDLDQEIADLLDDPHGWRPGPGEVAV